MGVLARKLLSANDVGLIEFVGGGITTKPGSGTSTFPLNSGLTGGIASSVSDGDFVIAVFATGSTADRTLSITDGTNPYTQIGSELYANSTKDLNIRAGYKFVSGDTTITFGGTGGNDDAGAMAVYVFRGVDTVTPLDVAVVEGTGTSETVAPASISPSTPGAFIVVIAAHGHGNGAGVTYSTSDLVDVFVDSENDVNDVTLGIGHKDDWVSGAFNPATWVGSVTSSASGNGYYVIALRPA